MSINDMKMIQSKIGLSIDANTKLECITCMKSKCTRLPFPSIGSKAKEILDLVHTDMSGKISIPNRENIRYFILFKDDHSSFTFIYLLKSKEEVFDTFKEFKNMVELQTNRKIKRLKSDCGTEYKNQRFNELCKDTGMQQMFTVPRCAPSNGTIERSNRTIDQKARCLLLDSELGISFFPYALLHAVHLVNRSPSRSINGQIPYEVFYGKQVDYGQFKRFGSRVIYLEDDEDVGKFRQRGKDGVYIGKPANQAGYFVYSTQKCRVIVRRHVQFVDEQSNQFKNENFNNNDEEESQLANETLFDYDDDDQNVYLKLNETDRNSENESIETSRQLENRNDEPENSTNETHEATADVNQTDLSNLPERSNITDLSCLPDIGYLPDLNDHSDLANPTHHTTDEANVENTTNCEIDEQYPQIGQQYTLNRTEKARFEQRFPKVKLQRVRPVNCKGNNKTSGYKVINTIIVPRSMRQVKQSSDRGLWEKAVQEEIQAMKDNGVWSEVSRPKDKQVLPLNWVFKIKYKPDGSVDKYKARLVVMGNLQNRNRNKSNYSPVMNDLSFKTLLAFGAKRKMHMHHLDICTAYLHADIEEEVYVELPPGMNGDGSKVLLLHKSMYGLRNSALNWYRKMRGILIDELGFQMSKSDQCVFYKNQNDKLMIIGLYVDDLLLLCSDLDELEKVKRKINSSVTVTDKGPVSQFLNLDINYCQETGYLSIGQTEYIKQLLEHFGMSDCNTKRTTVPSGAELFERKGMPLENPGVYMSIVGRLIYLSTHSRPDIAFVTNRLCSFMNCPTTHTLSIAKHVLQYLKYTMNYALIYQSCECNSIDVFCDADYANDKSDSKSINGVCIRLFGNLIGWSSRKQSSVSQSTCESEICAIVDGINESIYIRNFLDEVCYLNDIRCNLLNDNTSAISTCINGGDFQRNKQYRIKVNHIRNVLEENWLSISHCPSDSMPADFLTKPLSAERLYKLINIVNLI